MLVLLTLSAVFLFWLQDFDYKHKMNAGKIMPFHLIVHYALKMYQCCGNTTKCMSLQP